MMREVGGGCDEDIVVRVYAPYPIEIGADVIADARALADGRFGRWHQSVMEGVWLIDYHAEPILFTVRAKTLSK